MIVRIEITTDETLVYHTHDPVLAASFIHREQDSCVYSGLVSVELCPEDNKDYVIQTFNEMRVDVL
jgi:hypothetical protein